MKHLLFLMLIIPSMLWAQKDSKYLAGAVPEKDGKVVFSKEIKIAGQSKEQIFDTMLNWGEKYFNSNNSRVVYSNKEEGVIAAVGSQYLVFRSNAFVLDRTKMDYKFIISSTDNNCNIRVENIRYSYNVSYQEQPERYTAEEWITDKNALNKKKTKLNISCGKFRAKTIDFIETLFAESSKALGVEDEEYTAPKTAQKNTQTTLFSGKKRKGYTSYTLDKVPETLMQIISESECSVTPETQPKNIEKDITWKGWGNIFGKTIATIVLDKQSKVNEVIGKDGNYSINFFKNDEEEPWFIVECVKQGETAEGSKISIMGEVLNIWVK